MNRDTFDRIEDLFWLDDDDVGLDEAAKRLGISIDALEKFCERHRLYALYQRFKHRGHVCNGHCPPMPPRPPMPDRPRTPAPAAGGGTVSSNVRVAKVAVDKVIFHSHNVRRDLGDLRSLVASIKRFGLIQPIVVEDYGDCLRLRAGHRRLAAARLAGLKAVPALIHDVALDDDEWLVHSVQENVMRRGLDDDERRRAITALRDLGCTWDGIADAFGVRTSTIQSWATSAEERAAKRAKDATRHRPRVAGTTIRTFANAWRQESQRRRVTVEELLDALDAVGRTGTIADAVPDELARRRRTG